MATIVISVLSEPGTPVDQMRQDDNGVSCPLPTQDAELNAENKERAVEEANYRDPSSDGGFRLTEVCGNCGAYNQTEEMLECIGDESGALGYCQLLKFVCESAYTCDKWVEGGPMTAKVDDGYKDIL